MNNKKLIVFAMLLFSFVVSQACTSHTSSAALNDSITNKFNEDPELRLADISVSADADKNQATLKGTVRSEDIRLRAIALAKESREGLVVIDKIEVKPPELARANYDDLSDYTAEMAKDARRKAKAIGEKIGDSMEDAWIHTKIVAKLMENPKTPEHKINVDVVNNAVTLRGTVDSAEEKAEAERVVKATEHVKSVTNLIKVSKRH